MAVVVGTHLPIQVNLRDEGLILGQENPLEKGTATHASIFAQNPMDRGVWWAMVRRVAESDTTEGTWHARALDKTDE